MITKTKKNKTVLNFLEKHNFSYVEKGVNYVIVENVLLLDLHLSSYKTKTTNTKRYAVKYFNNDTRYYMKSETLLNKIKELIAEAKDFENI